LFLLHTLNRLFIFGRFGKEGNCRPTRKWGWAKQSTTDWNEEYWFSMVAVVFYSSVKFCRTVCSLVECKYCILLNSFTPNNILLVRTCSECETKWTVLQIWTAKFM
jgi:hypothetical protein